MHDKARESLHRLIEMFKSNDLPEAVANALIERQQSDAPIARWSLLNRLIVLTHDTSDARTFKQWQEAGRTSKKGSKAFHIFKPHTRKVKDEEAEDGFRTVVSGFGSLPVFRLEDTEGEPVEVPDYTPLELPPLAEVAERMGIGVRYITAAGASLGKGVRGVYSPWEKSIGLATHDVDTFFHELAHAAHDAITPGGLKGGQNPEQEVVAETVAATLCLLYGFDGYVRESRDYITSYAREDDAAKAIGRVLRQVEEVLEHILSFVEVKV